MVVSRSQMTAYADLLGRPSAGCTLQECPRYHKFQWHAPQEDPPQPCDQLTKPEHCPLPLSRQQDGPVLRVLVGLLSWEPTRRTPAAAAATARLFPLAQQAEIVSTSEQLGLEPDKKSEPGMKSDADAAPAPAEMGYLGRPCPPVAGELVDEQDRWSVARFFVVKSGSIGGRRVRHSCSPWLR